MRASKRSRRFLSLLAGGAIACASVLVPISAAGAAPAAPVTFCVLPTVTPCAAPSAFDVSRLGFFRFQTIEVTNNSGNPARVNPKATTNNGSIDYILADTTELLSAAGEAPDPVASCLHYNGVELVAIPIANSAKCHLGVAFVPSGFGLKTTAMTITVTDTTPALNTIASDTLNLSGTGVGGYYIAGSSAQWVTRGWSSPDFMDNPDGYNLASPVVGIAPNGTGDGFWLDAADGGVITAGDAPFLGSMGGHRLNKPVVGMAGTATGNGYWLVASDGGIFTFGDARFFGSTGAVHLNKPIVGMAATPTGNGYWLVASDGGIFTFGDARFFGSTGAVHLFQPIVGMSPSPTGQGYYLVAADGGIFTFGDVPFEDSLGVAGANDVVGMAPTTRPLFTVAPVAPASLASRAILAGIQSGRLVADSAATTAR